MMFGTFFLGILVLGCVFAFLYMAYQPSSDGGNQEGGERTADSILLIVNDSTLLE